jgi:hypothetical protein
MGGSLPRWCAPCLLAFAVSGAKGEETPPGGLDYRVAPGVQRCPSKAEFSALLSREVGGDPFATTPDLGLTVLLTPRTNGVSGVVEITEKGQLRGRRELNSGDCAALAAALALVVGVELDPYAQRQRSAPPPVATEVHATLPTEETRHTAAWYLAAGGLVAVGLAPTAVPGVTASVSIRPHFWVALHPEFALEFQGLPPVTAPLGSGSGSVSHVLWTGLGCVHPWWFLGGCLLGTGGVSMAEGFAGGAYGSQVEGYAAAGVRIPFLEVPAWDPNLHVVPHFDVAYQITREPLGDRAGATLWAPTLLTWNLGLALQGIL